MTDIIDDLARLVKPLVWQSYDVAHSFGRGFHEANSVIGYYTIDNCSEKSLVGPHFYVEKLSASFVSLEDAQAAAQADYTTRSLAALDTDALRAMIAERDMLREALVKITEGDVPRTVSKVFRADGMASKHDLCVHGPPMWQDCGECIDVFLIATLAKIGGAK